MPKVLAMTKNMPREEWLALRKQGIGSSDAAAVCGIGYGSALEVWLEKTGGKPPWEPGERQARKMAMGLQMEPAILRMFTEQTDLHPRRRNAILQHPEYPFMLCNLDYVLPGGVPVEIKNTEDRGHEWSGAQAPEQYLIQAHHQLAVTGAPYVYLVALINGWDLRIIKVDYDEEIVRLLIQREGEFWGYVTRGVMPPVDGSRATAEVLGFLYKAKPGMAINLAVSFSNASGRYLQAEEAEEKAKTEKEAAANEIKVAMAEAVLAIIPASEGVPGVKCSWPEIPKGPTFDAKRFAADHPRLFKRYSTPGVPYRRFFLNPIKTKED